MITFDELLGTYRHPSGLDRMKGSYLEQLVRQFLENDGDHALHCSDVWFWKEWPTRHDNFTNKDNGTDPVAARLDGGPTAIQVTFSARDNKIQKSDIDIFLSVSCKHPFIHPVVVDTTEWNFYNNATEMLAGRRG